MEYKGKYSAFDSSQIKTYPVSERTNKVKLADLKHPEDVRNKSYEVSSELEEKIERVAKAIADARKADKPVLLFTGAHLVKNGLSPLIGDLVKRNAFTIISGNGATSIHDFELGLLGETSEYVPAALEKGEFGMAYEFNYINAALSVGNSKSLGYGESVGRVINDKEFREEVAHLLDNGDNIEFKYPELSLQSICDKENVPFTVHVGIGTDVLDQHAYFDGRAKGGCSGRDFMIYTDMVGKLKNGGVILNVGSAVTGPEVFLKAASMTGNVGLVPNNIVTANFDIRPYNPETATNETTAGYYFRDQKSIVTRIPDAYGGEGHYIEGNQLDTIPMLYKKLDELL
jgi:hypothetical protein